MSKQRIDLLVTNATVYTVDENFTITEAIAIDKGKKVEIDSSKKLLEKYKEGWLVGRRWNQNDWPEKDFPTNEKLNELFPARPAILVRVDGHAMIANDKALELADINHTTQTDGGEVQIKNGKLTGV